MNIFQSSTFAGGDATSSSSELSESDLDAGFPFPIFRAAALTGAAEIDFGCTSESLSELESAAFLPACG
jgi:hypothetical protein